MMILSIIMSVISLILSIVFSIIILMVLEHILRGYNLNIPSINTNPEQVSDDFMEGIEFGKSMTNNLIHLAMFDMFTKYEILDYTEQVNNLLSRMDSIMEDSERITELESKLQQYLKDGENDTNNN